MDKKTYQSIQSFLLLSVLIIVGLTFYFEYAQGWEPCPLCIMQRLSAVLFGICCLIGLLFPRTRTRFLAGLQILFTVAGLYFGVRQIWLQSLPPEVDAMCMPGLDALMHYFSWNMVLKALFWGTSECGEVSWRWLGLSMPIWSALYFSCLLLVSLIVWIKSRKLVWESKRFG